MKKVLLLLALSVGYSTYSFSQRTCAAMENLDRLTKEDPRLVQKMDNLEKQVQQLIRLQKANGTLREAVTIPIVFHVLYNNAAENISEAQIMSQLTVLQEDFNKQNSDYTNTPSEFASLVADVGINFVLATEDPNGNPHSGITRTQTSKSSFSANDDMKFNSRGGHDAWPTGQYLNYWVCDLGSTLLGYAQFPGGPADTDGVVCHYKYTGTGAEGATAPYDLGRTATHEVGHWLNLRHIWGDATCGDDLVGDTPSQLKSSGGCPNHPQNSCTSNDMFMNYMDYTNDGCMYMFSEGQKERVLALFAQGGFRESFVTGGGTPPEASYCASKGNSVSDEWIADVTIGAFNNTTGANGGYADFTAQEITMAANEQVSLSLTPGFSGSAYNEYWKIWIDYNGDKDFDDAGELVFDGGSAGSGVKTGTFTVPASTVDTTRMRVSMKYNGAQTACEAFSYGEVEDYTVIFGEPQPEVCDAPTSVTSSGTAHNSFNISWAASANATSYDVELKESSSSTWSTFSTSNTSYGFTGLTASTSYDYRVRTQCSEGASGYSSTGSVTTSATPPPPPAEYCSSSANSSASEWIEQVIMGNISNTSDNDNGYGDYTNKVVAATQGDQISFTLNPGFSSSLFFGESTQPEYWRIWIDYNADKDFDDAGELVYDAGSTSTTNRTGSFTIPSNTAIGSMRVRVSMSRSSASNACGTFSNGEVEDYSISIAEPAAPTCNAPNNLSEGSVTSTDITITWSAATYAQSYTVQMRPSGGSWTSYATTNTSYSFSSLAAESTYDYRVASICSFGTSGYSSIGSSSTLSDNPTPADYCSSNGNNSSSEWIQKVVVGSISNTSGSNNGYNDYTSISAQVSKGNNVSLTLTPGFSSSLFGSNSYPEYWRIWVDYNQDGDFDDAGELAFDAGSTSTSAVSGSFTVPANAMSGSTRMRVSMKYNGASTPCESFSEGEVEDYTLVIGSGARYTAITTNDLVSLNMFPNPAKEMVSLTGLNNAEVSIIDVTGRLHMRLETYTETLQIPVAEWNAGVYMILVKQNNETTQMRLIVE
jgi:hypothetical protein